MNFLFPEMARLAFVFLEHAGFHLSQSGATRLEYEAARTFVVIEWDPRSGELNVFLGLKPRRGETRDMFSLTDLLAMKGVDVLERRMPFQIAEEEKLRPFLDKLAEDTKVHSELALAGDRMFFSRLKTFRDRKAQAYMRDMELRRVRAEAEQAWRQRDFDRLIVLYTQIEDQLTAAEIAKMAYAKRHGL